ncbi:MAG: hypothetical protein JST00_36635 [Deltaproteobacteria bacterium]|nr:hypothetical protein [Deltaproteobacteria bacterium]
MRKGRSHRRPRGSLSPMGPKSLQPLSSGGGVHVVVGHQGPSSQAPAEGSEPSVSADGGMTLEVVPERSLELVRQETLELVHPETLELVRQETLELVRAEEPVEPLATEPSEATIETYPAALQAEPAPEAEAFDAGAFDAGAFDATPAVPPPAAEDDPFDAPFDAPADEGSVRAFGAETPLVHMTAITTPSEISIPPASDLVVEPALERFFSEGDLAPAPHVIDEDDDWGDSPRSQKAKQKASPEAIARRAKFSRYVSIAVAGAAVVCIAAFARSLAFPGARATAKLSAPVAAVAPPAVKAAEPAVVAPAPVPSPAAEAKVAASPKPEEAKPADAPKPEEAKAADTTAKVEEAKADAPKPAVASDKTALEEKVVSRRALERGKLNDAIEAGERSVALDATDGEAWLLLGAAYQEKGNMKDARRCYAACLKEGKRGPVNECRAMLR